MKKLMIRFNTENKGNLFWRIVSEDSESLADMINIQVPSFTSQDSLSDGRTKFHITCYYSELVWSGTTLTII